MFTKQKYLSVALLTVVTCSLMFGAKAQSSDTSSVSKSGKNSPDELLSDLVKLPEAGASRGLGGVKDVILDTVFNRAGQVAKESEYDLLNRLELEYGLSEGGVDRYSILSVQPLYSSESGIYNLFSKRSVVAPNAHAPSNRTHRKRGAHCLKRSSPCFEPRFV